MAFKASKVRKKRARNPVAQGTQLVENAGITAAYANQLEALISQMVMDYKQALASGFSNPDVEDFYSEDASPSIFMKRVLNRLSNKWRKVFSSFAKTHAEQFAYSVDDYSRFSVRHSLKSLGLENPKTERDAITANILQASVAENVALISSIQEDFAKDIEGVVYRSLTSSDPEDNVSKVYEKLIEREGMTKRRAKLIATDQNSKLYTALNRERMKQNGVGKFKWKHSSAGKEPRHTHIARETQDVGYGPGIFALDSPELWEGPKQDRGLPGEAIRCRCRMIPIIDFDAD